MRTRAMIALCAVRCVCTSLESSSPAHFDGARCARPGTGTGRTDGQADADGPVWRMSMRREYVHLNRTREHHFQQWHSRAMCTCIHTHTHITRAVMRSLFRMVRAVVECAISDDGCGKGTSAQTSKYDWKRSEKVTSTQQRIENAVAALGGVIIEQTYGLARALGSDSFFQTRINAKYLWQLYEPFCTLYLDSLLLKMSKKMVITTHFAFCITSLRTSMLSLPEAFELILSASIGRAACAAGLGDQLICNYANGEHRNFIRDVRWSSAPRVSSTLACGIDYGDVFISRVGRRCHAN